MSFRAIVIILLLLGIGAIFGYLLFSQRRAHSSNMIAPMPDASPRIHRDRTIRILGGLILFLAAALIAVGYKLYIE
jgi:UDP-N-acetylmuramyl pentapeptide phosphotransferase/UDP-N-acetylglucosamine-1-phosphate transferase